MITFEDFDDAPLAPLLGWEVTFFYGVVWLDTFVATETSGWASDTLTISLTFILLEASLFGLVASEILERFGGACAAFVKGTISY